MNDLSDNSLWLTFQVDGIGCCILSNYIVSIEVLDKIEPLPGSPPTIVGMLDYGEKFIGVLEMREIFGKVNLKEYTEQFGIMKDMHVEWVEDLRRYVREGGQFTKAVDPHKCKFGVWYDGFQTDNSRLNRLLKKITAPHEQIHKCGADILRLKGELGNHEMEIMEKLHQAEEICDEEIVPMLNRLIEIYRSSNRGVIVVVDDGINSVGLLVDSVQSLVPCKKTKRQDLDRGYRQNSCVLGVMSSGDQLFLELDIEQIVGLKQLKNIEK